MSNVQTVNQPSSLVNPTLNPSDLSAKGLKKIYHRGDVEVPALRGIDIHLPAGTQVAIMGPSGCGKTTLLHCLACILRPTDGTVSHGTQLISKMKEASISHYRLHNFGFVFQDGQLLPELPNEENVALPLMFAGVGKQEAIKRARAVLAELGLANLGASRPGQVSGGQAQRVAIARALVTNPSVVFADEPTGALDQSTGKEVMNVLVEACRKNKTTLVAVTHDRGIANMLPYTIEMKDGQIIGGGRNK